jgi:FKBP12-rapamycin complex-associated protein
MDQRDESIHRLERLCNVVDLVSHCEKQRDRSLGVACWLELGDFQIEDRVTPNAPLPPALQVSVLFALKRAVTSSSSGYRAWHAWALLNFRLAEQLNKQEEGSTARQRNQSSSNSLGHHVVAAAQGFSNAISLGTKRWSASVQQDMLNLLTCLFKYGDLPDVANTINSGMRIITLEAWLGVLPQLLARIHIRKPSVRSVLHPLLTRLGEKHPQALMYPLSVLLKSPVLERKSAAESLMKALQAHSSSLVEEALIVSTELIRVAILWLETWHEGLEDASRLYFGEGNVSGMLELLMPLHERLENGAETQKEQEFVNSFGADLDQAHAFVKEYVRIVTSGGGGIPTQGGSDPAAAQYDQSGNLVRQSEEAETAMNKAWDIYYTVFRWINKQLPALTKLELNQCSPALSKAHSLELGVPGSYRVDGSYVRIEQFIPNVQVITSKQRPRKIILRGSDGKDYVFLLKGHEDLRQDERVMQLFGLVNALLARDRQTKKHDLNIQRYAISPLSHNCGVVGWVPHCETLHSMIRDYRANKKIPLNMENREMLKIAPDYDMLSVMQKVEVFTDALKRVAGRGNDLYEILWLKSTNSEEWLERRTRYTRSLAVMSMVGYILGLGDRHPSNLMLDQLSGRVLHIDFGDCFEVAMNREKYPEKIPFRLTRMLVKAMEVSGIEGSYRSTCERTMSVLRYSRDSLVAMLEAFVYDPLISWRLVGLSEKEEAEGDLEASHAVVRHEPAVEAHRNKLLALANPTTILDAVEDNDDEDCTVVVDEDKEEGEEDGAPIQVTRSLFHESIAEGLEEDGDENQSHQGGAPALRKPSILRIASSLSERIGKAEDAVPGMGGDSAMNAAKSRSFQMYSNIQTMAANLSTSSRIASITGDGTETRVAVEGSIAKSRIARSLRQREVMSLLEGQEGTANEEALNEKALKVIRRVQDKLSGTDLDENGESLDVPDQVQRLIVQATSSENLSQLFIGWCAFW